MRILKVTGLAGCLALGIISVTSALAQDAALSGQDTAALQTTASRITERIDDSRLVRLPGNIHPQARAEFDRGAVAPSLPMERIQLLLKRSPQQEAALVKFMDEQINPKSPNFHHWLTPEQFGSLYGPSTYDIQAVTNWLQNHGFSIGQVTKGRTIIEFSGTAAQVQETFHTEIHHFNVEGESHIANVSDPQIPAALSPVITGIVSLHNFFAKPMNHYLGDFIRDKKTGGWTPLSVKRTPEPLFTVPGSTPTFELIAPFDFATIYNLTPLWNAGIDGTGQTVAIAGRSDVSLADVQKFRSGFGLPANDPVFIVNGTDPGVPTANDKVENTLDVEWSGAAAPKATIKFVTTASTNSSDGASASAIYIINNNVAKIMSFSYGNCELKYGTAGNAFNNSLWQQAAAQGITAFVASGDQGSAACDGGGTPPYGAGSGLQVSGSSSTPYNVAVGGTDFNWANLAKSYWSSTNATNGSSALSYIPEVPWNGTCASTSVNLLYGFTAAGYDTEQACNYDFINSFDTNFLSVTGGTGGVSRCTAPTGTTAATCAGGYAKPSWQVGTGVPADGKRDVPDVSLFAAGGELHDAYVICDSQTNPCTYTSPTTALTQAVGGTSVASPAMAGIMALINQKMGSAQGNANAGFYALAAKDTRSACNTVTVAGGNTCNFYDVTTDNNAVPCVPGTQNCNVIHAGDAVGIVSGYSSTTGYDLATGLGSVNANNLVNNWASVTPTPAITFSPTSLSFPSTLAGATSAALTVTIKNTGTGAMTLTSETLTGANASAYLISANTCGASLAVNATCVVSIQFKPPTANQFSAALTVADNVAGSPQAVTIIGTGTNPPLTVTVSPATLTFASTNVGATTAAQAVTIKNTGTTAVTLTSETLTGTNASSYLISGNTCTSSLAVSATCIVSVEFKPTTTGTLTASLSVADNATGSPQSVALSGIGASTSTFTVSLSPAALTFASTAVGVTTAAQVVTIKNTGTGTVSLTSETITGTNATSFLKSATTCGATLAAAASCTVSVTFKPLTTGALTGSLSVADNASGSPQTVALTGTGVTGTTPTVTVTPTTIAFPAQVLGTTSDAQTVTVKNTGTVAVTISSIALGGTNPTAFLEIGSCGSTLAAGASCSLYVAFQPATAVALTATLSITDNATGSPQKVTLTGTGTTAPVVKLSTTALAFGTVKSGTTSPAKVVTITNSGKAALSILGINLVGTSPSSFVELNSCTSTLAPSASCSVYVAFTPKAVGAVTATLSIVDLGSTTTQTVALSGTGN